MAGFHVAELNPSNHGLTLRRYKTKPNVLVHEALIDFDGIITPAHVKIPIGRTDHQVCRVLFNEITGWLLAGALKLPVAEHVGVILLKPETVRGIYGTAPDPEGSVAWVSSTVGGATPFDLTGPDISPLLQKDLSRWKALPRAVGFDQWAANSDRNLKNFVRKSAGDYVLIDHDQLLSSDAWSASDLLASVEQVFTNKLERIAYSGAMPRQAASAVAGLLREAEDALISISGELHQWWEDLVPPEDGEAVNQFLVGRSKTMLDAHRVRYGIIA